MRLNPISSLRLTCFFGTTALFFVSFFLTSLSTMFRRLLLENMKKYKIFKRCIRKRRHKTETRKLRNSVRKLPINRNLLTASSLTNQAPSRRRNSPFPRSKLSTFRRDDTRGCWWGNWERISNAKTKWDLHKIYKLARLVLSQSSVQPLGNYGLGRKRSYL